MTFECSSEIVHCLKEVLIIWEDKLVCLSVGGIGVWISGIEDHIVQVAHVGNNRVPIFSIFHGVFDLEKSLHQWIIVDIVVDVAHESEVAEYVSSEGLDGVDVINAGELGMAFAEGTVLNWIGIGSVIGVEQFIERKVSHKRCVCE